MSRVGGEAPSGAARTPALDEAVEIVRTVVAANVAATVELVERVDALVRRVAAEGPSPPSGPGDVLGRLVEAGTSACAEVGGHALAALQGLVADHREEARLVAGWLRDVAAAVAGAPAGGADDEPAAPPAGGRPSPAAEELHRSPTLLR
jgi:hypothetical protein